MSHDLSAEVKQLVAEKMASGKYASEDDLLFQALQTLSDYDDVIRDVELGVEDEQAGRTIPLRDVDAQLRRKYSLPRDA